MNLSRREFLRNSAVAVSAAAIASTEFFALNRNAYAAKQVKSQVMVSIGGGPAENVRKVVEALGGMGKFVKKGDKVFIKPNCISGDKPQAAVNTNPEVVAEVARLCKIAGASEILAMGHDSPTAHTVNGIGEALEAHGGSLIPANSIDQYRTVALPRGIILREIMAINELLDYDVFINLPIAKHHAGTQLTVGMKNYMGLIWNRIIMHQTDIHQTIADLATVRKPDLVIVDATRMMLTNGPSGPGQVAEINTIIASTDPLAADAYTASLFKKDPASVKHFQYAYDMGLGEIYLDRMAIKEFDLSR